MLSHRRIEYLAYLEDRIKRPFALDPEADNTNILQYADLFNRAVEIFDSKKIVDAQQFQSIPREEKTIIENNLHAPDHSYQSERLINMFLTDWIVRIMMGRYHVEELTPGRLLVCLSGLIERPIKEMVYYPLVRAWGTVPDTYNMVVHYSFTYEDVV